MADQITGNPELATLVTKRIQATGRTLKEIAEEAGLNSSHLSLIKSGKRSISMAAARKLAEALNQDSAKLEYEIEELIEASQSRSNRMVSLPVVSPRRAFAFTVPAHYFNVLSRLEYKIANQDLLNKEALIEFERNWRRGGTIYIYEEKDEKRRILEMHDSDFRALTIENIRQRKITYHFFTSDDLEAKDLATHLDWQGIDKSKLHIYKPHKSVDAEEGTGSVLSDAFARKRICVMYISDDAQPIVYEKVLDDPFFFHKVDPWFASKLRMEFEKNIGMRLEPGEQVKWEEVDFSSY